MDAYDDFQDSTSDRLCQPIVQRNAFVNKIDIELTNVVFVQSLIL